MNLIKTTAAASVALLVLAGGGEALAKNKYETAMSGTWEISGEADLFVLEPNNSCYRVDEDGIKTSRRGRWRADAKRLTMELKYNGKKYRSVFRYEQVSKDQYKLTIEKAYENGKPKKPKKTEVTATRKK